MTVCGWGRGLLRLTVTLWAASAVLCATEMWFRHHDFRFATTLALAGFVAGLMAVSDLLDHAWGSAS